MFVEIMRVSFTGIEMIYYSQIAEKAPLCIDLRFLHVEHGTFGLGSFSMDSGVLNDRTSILKVAQFCAYLR